MHIRSLLCAFLLVFAFSACNEDDDGVQPQYRQSVFNYAFNTGQLSGKSQYNGSQPKTLMAKLTIDELPPDSVRVTVDLKNTQNGVVYPVGAYDKNDTTGYTYALTPNARLFAQTLVGNGGIVSAGQLARYKYDSLLNYYNGYLIVRDLAAAAGTNDSIAAQSQLIIGTFAR